MQAIYSHAAKTLLQEVTQRKLALAESVVLLPNMACAQEFSAALAQYALPESAFPRWMTLSGWAETSGVTVQTLPDSRRAVLLFQALRGRNWIDMDSLWPVCRELAQLFDELTLYHITLPTSLDEFSAQLAQAYQTHATQDLGFEASLVHALWFASLQSHPDDAVPASARYVLQLAALAHNTHCPIFTFGLGNLSALNRAEQQCLATCAAQAGVIVLDPPPNPWRCSLAAAWPQQPGPGLSERAQAWHAYADDWQQRLRLVPTHDLTHEAHCAARQIRDWLHAGLQRIAVVVLDRVSARRLRAILEQDGIPIQDETGWALDTTVAATWVMQWLQTVRADFSAERLRDWLSAPSPLPVRDSANLAHQLETLRIQFPLLTGLDNWRKHVHKLPEGDGLMMWLDNLATAARALAAPMQSLSGWLHGLQVSLDQSGVLAWLLADQAGSQLWQHLQQCQHELQDHSLPLTLDAFIHWLSDELSVQTFIDATVHSPVIFTHLAATRGRIFDATLLLGADETRLRPGLSGGLFFNQRVRNTLGLPGYEQADALIRDDLVGLLASTPQVRVMWQSEQAGETRQVASWFVRMNLVHKLATGRSLFDEAFAQQVSAAFDAQATPDSTPAIVASSPRLLPALLPEQISVSGLKTLVACPYAYFAASILGLQAPEADDPDMGKQDYGQLVHHILQTFHTRVPSVRAIGKSLALTALQQISTHIFAQHIEEDVLVLGWQQRWLDKLEEYLDWQIARETNGFYWTNSEQKYQRDVMLPTGQRVRLQGRIDRLDRKDGQLHVLDYKTSALKTLREAAAHPDEDVQLAAYAALLTDQVVESSAFIVLDGEQPVQAITAHDLPVAQACIEQRLQLIFSQLYAGSGLPANGAMCQHCSYTGVCRRG